MDGDADILQLRRLGDLHESAELAIVIGQLPEPRKVDDIKAAFEGPLAKVR
jgi:hypothetical protein